MATAVLRATPTERLSHEAVPVTRSGPQSCVWLVGVVHEVGLARLEEPVILKDPTPLDGGPIVDLSSLRSP